METRSIRNDLFFSEVAGRIAGGERVRIRAKGNSMRPFIRDNRDLIVLEKPNARSFQRGRLLLVQMPEGNYVLHRVKKTGNNRLVLQGDGNLLIFETCTTENVIAEATGIIRDGKSIGRGSFQWNLYHYLWPKNLFLRRICLALYRRISLQ